MKYKVKDEFHMISWLAKYFVVTFFVESFLDAISTLRRGGKICVKQKISVLCMCTAHLADSISLMSSYFLQFDIWIQRRIQEFSHRGGPRGKFD